MRRTRTLGGLTAVLVLAVAAIGILILGVSLIDSGIGLSVPPPIRQNDQTPLVRVEDKVFTKFHLDVTRDYHILRAGKTGYVIPDYGILLDAMSLAAWEEILKRHGRAITPDVIAAERARMIRESKDRETQNKIFLLLDPYPGMYEMIVVRPSIANHWIYKLHDTDRIIQREAYEKAEAGLKEALRDSEDFFRRRKEEDPDVCKRIDSRDPEGPHKPPGGPPPPKEEEERARKQAFDFVNEHLSRLEPGQVKPNLVEVRGAYLIARLVERSADHVVYDVVGTRKNSFEVWFEGELKKLKGEVLDPVLRQQLKDNLKDHTYGRWLFGDNPK